MCVGDIGQKSLAKCSGSTDSGFPMRTKDMQYFGCEVHGIIASQGLAKKCECHLGNMCECQIRRHPRQYRVVCRCRWWLRVVLAVVPWQAYGITISEGPSPEVCVT